MPSFDIEVEFEVFCGKCGAGLCHAAETRVSRNRLMPQLTVEPCRDCMDSMRHQLEDEIEYLKGEVERLRNVIDEVQQYERS